MSSLKSFLFKFILVNARLIIFLINKFIKLIDKLYILTLGIIFLIKLCLAIIACVFVYTVYSNISNAQSININYNVVEIKGDIKTQAENYEIFVLAKDSILAHEGIAFKAYHLDGEFYIKNGMRYKVYTICTGQTTIKDKKGDIIRYVNKDDKMTVKECDEMFKVQYEYYNKLAYISMTDKYGVNYYNTLKEHEIAGLINLIWWCGKNGSKYIAGALINYAKYRTEAGRKRLIKSFNKYSKKCHSKYKNGCNKRGKEILNLILYGYVKNI